jgi:hypothetical protein
MDQEPLCFSQKIMELYLRRRARKVSAAEHTIKPKISSGLYAGKAT